MSAVSVDMSTDGNVTNINTVPVAPNHATSPYDNIMYTFRRESTGRSVEPSNVTGTNNQHEMWIRQMTGRSSPLMNFRFVRSTT